MVRFCQQQSSSGGPKSTRTVEFFIVQGIPKKVEFLVINGLTEDQSSSWPKERSVRTAKFLMVQGKVCKNSSSPSYAKIAEFLAVHPNVFCLNSRVLCCPGYAGAAEFLVVQGTAEFLTVQCLPEDAAEFLAVQSTSELVQGTVCQNSGVSRGPKAELLVVLSVHICCYAARLIVAPGSGIYMPA